MLGAPMGANTEGLLADAVAAAAKRNLVAPGEHIVCLMAVRSDLVLKVRIAHPCHADTMYARLILSGHKQ